MSEILRLLTPLLLYVVFGLICGFLWFFGPILQRMQEGALNKDLPKRLRHDSDVNSQRIHWISKVIWGLYIVGGTILSIVTILKASH
jgi:hypothetical protein